MRDKAKAALQIMIAALLISGAAICAAGQSGNTGKQNAREQPTNSTSTTKQNTREAQAKPETVKPSQTATPSAKPVDSEAKPASYSYEFSNPTFLINHILIEHDGDGRGNITFERRNGEPITDPVELSPAAMARIKALWDALHFLDSDKSYQTEKQYPHLGTNRLHMKQGTRDRLAEFNWTSDHDAFALVAEYKGIANQAIFIFDITLARENQPLESPKLMDQFDEQLRHNQLSDPQQLIPLLRDLSTDERLPLMARNHAARILKKIEK